MSKLRIVPLGGVDHVTRNMFVYEFWSSPQQVQRLIVDCGMGFPEEEMLGVDLVLPDISYLKGKEKSILGMILTHGHDDHIGGLPYILPQLGNIPIFASRLTAGLAQSTCKEFGFEPSINVLNDKEWYKLGSFQFEFIHVTHSVPDTKHVLINTPIGSIYHGSDFKFDFTPVDGKRPDLQEIALVGKKGVLCLLSDCLRVEKEGFTPSETLIEETLTKEARSCQGKFIVTTISSNIHRIQQAVWVAAAQGRKVVFLGRSITENIAVAQSLGYFKMPQGVWLHRQRIKKMPDNKLCLIVAGSQGQEESALVRIANDRHESVRIKPGDKVVFSVDPIPGNENAFYRTIDKLSRLGAVVSYSDILDDLHVSGHASSGELKILLGLVNPKYILPIGGTFRHMNHYRDLAMSMQFTKDRILILNEGQIVSFNEQGKMNFEETLTLKTVIVDGSGVGDVGRVVLSDRKKMSEEGIVVVTVPLKKGTSQIVGEAEIISRGFVYMRSSLELMAEAKKIVRQKLPKAGKIQDWPKIKINIEESLSNFFFSRTKREPMVLAVIVKV